jgi:uncharacterized membrane protein
MFFLVVKWIHVLAAITAVGANITYGMWIAQASRQAKVLPFVLRNIHWIDSRVANPCYGLLLLTGLTMAFILPIPLTTPWLLTALILYILAAVLGIVAYAPAVRRQIQLLETKGFDSPDYQAVARRSTLFGILVTVDVILIVFLMVVKPALWG